MTAGRDGQYADGRVAVERTAITLLQWGMIISAPELLAISELSPRRSVNAPDVLVWSRRYDPPGSRAIEVKGLNTSFSDHESWPHPRVFVDRRDTLEAKEHRPFAYVIWSNITGAAAVVPLRQIELFEWRDYDSRSETDRVFVCCKPEELQSLYWLRAALDMGDTD